MFAITDADRVFLACGAGAGFCLVLYVSHSLLLALFLGVPPAIGANCIVLIIMKLIWPDGIERLNIFRLSPGRRYWMVAIYVLFAVCIYWQPVRNNSAFALVATMLTFSEFGVLSAYFWYRDSRSAH
jgi:hypothetical protein